MNEVGTELITTRRVVFTPNVDIKDELKRTSINITCYDRNGNVVKRVTSSDDAEIEDNETGGSSTGSETGTTETGGTSGSGSSNTNGTNQTNGSESGSGSGSGSGSTTGGGSDNTGGGDNGGGDDDVEGTGGDE